MNVAKPALPPRPEAPVLPPMATWADGGGNQPLTNLQGRIGTWLIRVEAASGRAGRAIEWAGPRAFDPKAEAAAAEALRLRQEATRDRLAISISDRMPPFLRSGALGKAADVFSALTGDHQDALRGLGAEGCRMADDIDAYGRARWAAEGHRHAFWATAATALGKPERSGHPGSWFEALAFAAVGTRLATDARDDPRQIASWVGFLRLALVERSPEHRRRISTLLLDADRSGQPCMPRASVRLGQAARAAGQYEAAYADPLVRISAACVDRPPSWVKGFRVAHAVLEAAQREDLRSVSELDGWSADSVQAMRWG